MQVDHTGETSSKKGKSDSVYSSFPAAQQEPTYTPGICPHTVT